MLNFKLGHYLLGGSVLNSRGEAELGEFGVVGAEVAAGVAFFELEVGDAVEGDADRRVIERTQRAAEDDGVFAELFVDVVERGVEAGAAVAVVDDAGEHRGVSGGRAEIEERDADAVDGRRRAGSARAAGPEKIQDTREFERVLRLGERGGGAPAFAARVAEGEVHAAGVETGGAQAHGGFLEKTVECGLGAGEVAQGWRQDV